MRLPLATISHGTPFTTIEAGPPATRTGKHRLRELGDGPSGEEKVSPRLEAGTPTRRHRAEPPELSTGNSPAWLNPISSRSILVQDGCQPSIRKVAQGSAPSPASIAQRAFDCLACDPHAAPSRRQLWWHPVGTHRQQNGRRHSSRTSLWIEAARRVTSLTDTRET